MQRMETERAQVQAEYGLEQLTSAVLAMAESREPLQQRLLHACVYDMLNIDPERDLPDELRGKFVTLSRLLHCQPATADQDGVAAAISAMNDDEARGHINTIGQLYRELAEYLAARP